MGRAEELRQAVSDCRQRALHASAKWAAAALCGLPEEELMGASQQASTSGGGGGTSPTYELARCLFDQKVRCLPVVRAPCARLLACGTCSAAPARARACHHRAACTSAACASARASCRRQPPLRPPNRLGPCPPRALQEYRSAAHMLAGAEEPLPLFLRCYATYLAGEKRKE